MVRESGLNSSFIVSSHASSLCLPWCWSPSSSRSFALPGSEAPNSVIAAMAVKTVLIPAVLPMRRIELLYPGASTCASFSSCRRGGIFTDVLWYGQERLCTALVPESSVRPLDGPKAGPLKHLLGEDWKHDWDASATFGSAARYVSI